MGRGAKAREILLIEDSPGEARLITESLKRSTLTLHLTVVEDGGKALAFLRREGEYTHSPRPDLILLDMDLAKGGGPEVLARIKADSRLRWIPLVALATSDQESEITQSYDLQVNCYVTKPMLFEDFAEIMRAIEEFWFMTARLPGR